MIRSKFNKTSSSSLKGEFICEIIKGYGDLFSLRLNKENNVGGLTTINGKTTTTTTTIFTIVE